MKLIFNDSEMNHHSVAYLKKIISDTALTDHVPCDKSFRGVV